jgi:hypothetical protein
MSISLRDRIPFGRVLIALAAVFVVAAGLFCLFTNLPYPFGPEPREKFSVGIFGGVAGVVVLLSAVGFVVMIAIWVGAQVSASFSRQQAEPQRLFYEADNKNRPS